MGRMAADPRRLDAQGRGFLPERKCRPLRPIDYGASDIRQNLCMCLALKRTRPQNQGGIPRI